MKKEKITSFLSGVVSCTLVLGLATTALAATGNMSFGRVNVRLNSEEVFAQGEELRTDAGQAIPSSITYTDETGGDTTYVPLSYLSRLLDTPVGWDQASKTVKLGYSAALPDSRCRRNGGRETGDRKSPPEIRRCAKEPSAAPPALRFPGAPFPRLFRRLFS